MKLLKSQKQYVYDDFKAMQCGGCKKKFWDRGPEIVRFAKLRCPQCGIVYSFEPIRWKVLKEIPEA
jgi:DNA-directed RNA polymerase subunit RPC12/RpoP